MCARHLPETRHGRRGQPPARPGVVETRRENWQPTGSYRYPCPPPATRCPGRKGRVGAGGATSMRASTAGEKSVQHRPHGPMSVRARRPTPGRSTIRAPLSGAHRSPTRRGPPLTCTERRCPSSHARVAYRLGLGDEMASSAPWTAALRRTSDTRHRRPSWIAPGNSPRRARS
jgi:hypothetical protein